MKLADENVAKDKLISLLLKKQGIAKSESGGLVRRSERGPVPLSYAQQRLWFVDHLNGASTEYNMSESLRLRGDLDRDALRRAIQTIVARHESLRTHFAEVDGKPVQVILPELRIALPIEDLRTLDEDARQAAVEAAVRREAEEPFDLSRGPLIRVKLLILREQDHILLRTLHHIVSDGWSAGVFNQEFVAFYDAFRKGRENPLNPPGVQYADFAMWQRRRLDGGTLEQGLKYWKEQLAGAPERSPLADRGLTVQTFSAELFSLTVPKERMARLKELSQANHATLYMILLAGFALLLKRHTGQDDIVVGSPVANRQESQLEQMIGFFVNWLVIRVRVSSNATFRELLTDVRRICLNAYAHQEIPFERLVEELAPERSLNTTPLFQVVFALQNAPAGPQRIEGLEIEPVAGKVLRVRYDLEVHAIERDGELEMHWLYNRDLFSRGRIERLASHYTTQLKAAVETPDLPLHRIQMLSPSERQSLLEGFNATACPLSGATLPELFEAQVARDPDATALAFGKELLTYRELNRRANRLAHHLIDLGVGPESLVGLSLERSNEMIVTLLGILKAGGAYVPLDADLPAQRRNSLIADGGIRHLVTLERNRHLYEDVIERLVTLDGNAPALARQPERNPAALRVPNQAAYVNYTSGSTGQPKGVLVPHEAVERLVEAPNYVRLDSTSRLLQLAPISFDAATFEIWGALLNGGTVVIMPPGPASIEEIGAVLVGQRVDTLFLTTGLFNQMVDSVLPTFSGLRQMLTGGEVQSVRHMETFRRAHPQCQLISCYGPTENTTFSCCYRIPMDADLSGGVPIGSPINNTRAYVLDGDLAPAPVGVTGELYVAGAGLARAYLNQPELTGERFLPDPYGSLPGGRMYRTGDLARWRIDGVLEFLGRTDRQVKIRGFRIEPGEIETALRTSPGVRDTIVVTREDETGRRLVAYVVPQPTATIDLDAVRAHLGGCLPAYMQPSSYAVLPALPLKANGKVDYSLLPIPENDARHAHVAPRLPDEQLLAGIWSHLLRAGNIGLDDNFFECGGHSLLATQLISRVRDAFKVAVPLRLLFDNPTLGQFARALRLGRSAQPDFAPPLRPVQGQGPPPLSFAQERLWFLNQLEPENPFYNISLALRLTGALDMDALRQALNGLVQRHESLRTTFQSLDGVPVQMIAASAVVPMPVFELAELPPEIQEREVRRMAEADARKPFDLSRDMPVRTHLLHLEPEENILLLSMHHIISDGWSMGVLTQDLSELYNAIRKRRDPALSDLLIQYADFAEWQRRWLSGEVLERQLAYWKAQLAGAPPDLKLPTDRPRPPIQSFRGRIETFEIEPDLAADLRKLSNESGTTLFMTLLAGFSVLLARYSDQRDLVIGSPIANRTHSELEPLIGFFVNTLALRIRIEDGLSLRELLARVRQGTLDAYAHQDLPFERLVDELQMERDLSRNPLFQVMFTLQNAPEGKRSLEGLEIEPVKSDVVSAQFDLVLDIWETDPTLRCVLEYSTDLFNRDTVAHLLRHYRNVLAQMVSNPEQTVSDVPLIDAEERRQLLDEFNPIQKNYPSDFTLHELFEEQVTNRPGSVAIVDEHSSLTYGELNVRANRIAHLLCEMGVIPGQAVGILDDRGCDLLASMLGVLKAGGAFLPLDPEYPEDRIRYMVADSQISTLITRRTVVEKFPSALSATTLRWMITLDGGGPIAGVPDSLHWCGTEQVGHSSSENLRNRGTSRDVAYLLYTSGSTGLPKGAMIRHEGAVNHIYAEFELLSFHPNSVFLQSAPCSSDISVWQFLAPCLIGARVVVADFETVCDPARLFARIRGESVTLVELVPVVLGALLDHVRSLPEAERVLPDLQCAMVTGESASVALINAWLKQYPRIPIVNAYGPTEAADDVCQHAITAPLPADAPNVPIGKPLANVWLYVLDRNLHLVPAGVPGEICVSGIAVGNGYWNDPDKTNKSFVPNPYADPKRGRTLYRTGDLGRWLPDGNLVYLGRLDEQVKLRGFRIEPGEIESVITRHAAVHEAAVLARTNDTGEKSLSAYIVPQFGQDSAVSIEPLEEEQITLWSDLHDDSYGGAQDGDPTFNCIGWDSNYTGQPLPEAEMREYIDFTVNRILALKPCRLLEIGCGTGLLMVRLVSECERYLGIDLSATVIEQLRTLQRTPSLRARVRGLAEAEFKCCRADRIVEIGNEKFDVAILPSVVQYFPSLNYLEKVLHNLAVHLLPRGAIFVGDVRNLPLLKAFHASVQLFKSSPDLPSSELRRRIERNFAQEQELCVHPAYFSTLPQRIPEISSVEILPKAGRHLNEMTRFRYDVVIYLGQSVQAPNAVGLQDWNKQLWTDFMSNVRRGCRSQFGLANVPNTRVLESLRTLEFVSRHAPINASAMRALLEKDVPEGMDPQDVWDFALAHDYQAAIQLSADGEPGAFDMWLKPKESCDDDAGRPLRVTMPRSRAAAPLNDLANHPLIEKFARAFVPEFRLFLKARLPNYMVPSNFVVLDRLPLTAAGKVDRRALNEIPQESKTNSQEDAQPETDGERTLAAIWSSILGVDRVGRHDNFFNLGGHSLKATQVVSRIQKELGLTISLREVFNNPTIAEFAPLLDNRSSTGSSSISRIPDAERYPVSHAQRRLWILHQMEPQSAAYNMPSAVVLEGKLDRVAFERALAFIVLRHESLRTVLLNDDGEPRQHIRPNVRPALVFVDLRPDPNPILRARHLAEKEALRPFDLAQGPLFRLSLLQVADERHIFLATLHHIISDDWSGVLLMRQLACSYSAYVQGSEPDLEPLRIHYRDYCSWQNTLLLGESAKPHREYWHRQLAGDLPILEMPLDRPRPAQKSFKGDRIRFEWDAAFAQRLTEFGQQHGSSLYMTLLGAVTVLLHRYSQQREIVVGSPVAGRTHADLEDQIGFYVNTLGIRQSVDPKRSFEAFLKEAVRIATEALDHQIYPFDRLVNELNLRRDVSRSPLFDVMVVLQNVDSEAIELPGLKLLPFEYTLSTSQFDLTFSFDARRAGIRGEITFATDLFERPRIERMADHLHTLIQGFLTNPRMCLDSLPLVSPGERAILVDQSNRLYSGSRCVTDTFLRRFEVIVATTPQASAVSFENQLLTYHELNSRANQLTRRLQKLGVSRGRRVGLFVPRSIDTVVAVLAILKTGAAYVPFDSDYPAERITFMAEDSDISALVTHPTLAGALTNLLPRVPRVNLIDPSLATESPENQDGTPMPSDVAYIIYTSGSTGKPKGVPVTHANVVRLFDTCQPWFNFDRNDVWTLFHSIAFDFSVWELWGALLYGGRLVVVPYWESRSPGELLKLLARERVTVLNQTPSAFRHLVRAEEALGAAVPALGLRYIIFGGEALELQSLRPWFNRHGDEHPRLINMYGITETTVHVTYRPLSSSDLRHGASVIGTPLPDLQLYLLDSNLEPVPLGVPGEIYVGGAGVTQGYLNRTDLTAERFLPNLYAMEAGSRLYRTGDLARRLANGDVEYLGRIDQQVKIRGFRIELGEIESCLVTHPRIREAVVIPVNEGDATRLAAYVVTQPDVPVSASELRSFLRAQLPEFMLPASFTFLDRVPLTPHGKLDRSALPQAVEALAGINDRVLPRTEIEKTIAGVWTELLGIADLGIQDNIFDLGAHSLLVIRAHECLQERGGWDLTILDLFRYPTIQSLAHYLCGLDGPDQSALIDAEDRAAKQREARRHRITHSGGAPR
jgi:amino acid adenylation domain-containing protein